MMMMERKGIIVLIANVAITILGCNGFLVPTPYYCHRCPTSAAALGNDYLESFNNNNDDDDSEEKCSSPNDYLNSLSNNSNDSNASNNNTIDKSDASSTSNEQVMRGGMFNVQANYFGSLGAAAGTYDDSNNDASASSDVDDWDAAAAFLDFNIGPETDTIIDSLERAAAAQQSYFSDDEHRTKRMTHEEMTAHYKARLCPKMLLTQRAIQSFMYLGAECRDPHSGKWLEDFLELQNLGNYHGTGAFNITRYPTGDAVLYDIMKQPNHKMIVSAKRRGRGHGGWSKDNPYLRERWVEFNIDIQPASLVQRLLSVMEQIAQEFDRFLDVVRIVDEQIMGSYFDHLHVLASRQHSPLSGGMTFHRISADIVTNITDFQEGCSSPLFRGNFDLLYSLCTQASAYRLLRDLQSHSTNDITSQWFEQFYNDNVPVYFDGDQPFGRADDFLDLLFRNTPALVVSPNGEPIGWTDPLWVAERIISIRSEIAWEWKDVMREVKEDHLKLSNDLFRLMMEGTIDESGNDAIEIEEEITFDDLSDSAGVFE